MEPKNQDQEQTGQQHEENNQSPLQSPIYEEGRSPASTDSQARVDQLIDSVNNQVELLTFDDPDPFLLRQMVEALVDPRRATRLRLVDTFGEIGESATPFLLEGLAHHAESVVRRACCNALTKIGDPDSVSGLIEALLKDPDISVKSAAAGALAKVGAPAFDALREVLGSEKASESCKGHAAWAMASMSSEVKERLYRIMSDPSAAVRTAVIGAIAHLVQQQTGQQQKQPTNSQPPVAPPRSEEAQKALTILTEALSDQSSEVRIEAAANLARLNCQKAYQPLIACLKDPEGAVRRAAVMALAKLGNTNAIEAIQSLQRDSEISVQRAATLAIGQLEQQMPKQKPQ
ncbi:MAG: HEAT repeat domain-containing protein [Phormidesmis sp.]